MGTVFSLAVKTGTVKPLYSFQGGSDDGASPYRDSSKPVG
jgi:hypothetical protein